MVASWAFFNTAQALAFLSFFGLLLCMWRLRESQNPMHLIAFALMLGGTFMRELVALHYGAVAWPETALALSAFARVLKIAGAILFVHVVTYRHCGNWAWISVAVGSFLFALTVPV